MKKFTQQLCELFHAVTRSSQMLQEFVLKVAGVSASKLRRYWAVLSLFLTAPAMLIFGWKVFVLVIARKLLTLYMRTAVLRNMSRKYLVFLLIIGNILNVLTDILAYSQIGNSKWIVFSGVLFGLLNYNFTAILATGMLFSQRQKDFYEYLNKQKTKIILVALFLLLS